MAESTPFLPAASSNNVNFESTPNTLPPANPTITKTIRRLTNTSLFGSLVSLIVITATFIVFSISPIYSWSLENNIGSLAFLIALSALLSFFNRTSIRSSNSTPLTLNIIFDLILSFGIGIACLRFVIDAAPDLRYPRCGQDYNGPEDGPERSCSGWVIIVSSLGVAAALGALVVGVSHLTLLLLRGKNMWRSRFWSRPFPWVVPAGEQFAIEFNVRVVRSNAERVVGAGHGARIEGDAEAGRLVEV